MPRIEHHAVERIRLVHEVQGEQRWRRLIEAPIVRSHRGVDALQRSLEVQHVRAMPSQKTHMRRPGYSGPRVGMSADR